MTEKESNQQKHKEKPLSLYPMSMDEALREALQVKPPPKTDKKPTGNRPKRNTPK